MQKSYCYTPGVRVRVRVRVGVSVGVGVRMQNVRANVKVMEFQSLCNFSCILTLLIILIKPFTTKAHDRRASGDCGTSGGISICLDIIQIQFDFYCVWSDCTPDIFFCLNLVFRTFFCGLARYWHQIWGMNFIDIIQKVFHIVSFHVFFLQLCLFEICWGR